MSGRLGGVVDMYSKELKKLCSLKKVVSVFIGGSNWGWRNWESYAFWMVCWVLALAGVLSGFCVVSPQVARSVADFGDPNVVHLALGASPATILHALPYFPEPDSRIQSPSTSNRAAPQAEQRHQKKFAISQLFQTPCSTQAKRSTYIKDKSWTFPKNRKHPVWLFGNRQEADHLQEGTGQVSAFLMFCLVRIAAEPERVPNSWAQRGRNFHTHA